MVNIRNERFDLNAQRSLAPFLVLIIVIVGVQVANILGTEAGRVYSNIITASFIVMFLAFFFLKESDTNYIEIPIEKNVLQFELMTWMGIVSVPIFNIVTNAIFNKSSFQVVKPFAIFATSGISGLGTELKVVQLQVSDGVNYFFNTWVAAGAETWVFNITIVIIGFIIAQLLIQMWLKNTLNEQGQKTFRLIVGLLISSGLFMLSHALNKSYDTPQEFIIAGIFLLVMNIILYYFNAFFGYVFGFHFANNFLATWSSSIAGSMTLIGLILNAILLMTLIHLIINAKEIPALFKRFSPSI